jgi:RimJ/RimL family protein N-acetyltransferase
MNDSSYFWQGQLTRLRPLSVDDTEEALLDRLDSSGRQMLQLGVELPTSAEAMRERLARLADCRDVDGLILFTIENLDGQNVGGLSYHTRNRKDGNFSFGVRVTLPFRGRGYAADAVRVLLRYAFLERRYHKCNSACVENNVASARLHLALGFREEGRRRETLYYNGRYYDELLFGLTRDEFDAADESHRPDWMRQSRR